MNDTFCVPCLLGVEGLVADELRYQHFEGVRTENGRVYFEGPMSECARANVRLRCGERVLLRLASFPAYTFEDLFQGVKSIPWADYLQQDSIFPVAGYCVGSQLHSVPDCQRIIKKAVVECLKESYALSWFPETGVKYQIRFALLEDQAEIYLDTTGAPLYKRGYRLATQQAPLRETLAASLVKITRYRGREEMIDPFCGSGTLAIEAAMVCCRIAPGARRSFEGESWLFADNACWEEERQRALGEEVREKLPITASDISGEAVELARENARRAGVEDLITIRRADALGLPYAGRKGVLLTNPPYGQRLSTQEEARALYDGLGRALHQTPGLKKYIITSDPEFETYFGAKADKRRKLYNGMLKCQLFMYYKQAVEEGREKRR